MKMIRHQTIGMESDRIPLKRFKHQFQERPIILIFWKHFLPSITPIDYVVVKSIR